MNPTQVGIGLFALCLVLGLDMNTTLIIVVAHYIMHTYL